MMIRLTNGVGLGVLVLLLTAGNASAFPPKLTIIHFDVNVGDATLIISPDNHAVLIDGGDRGRGNNPIIEYLNRAAASGHPISLDFTIATHYDSDHIGGLDEVIREIEPNIAVYDRGNSNLRPLVKTKLTNCPAIDFQDIENLAPWGGAPLAHCPKNSRAITCSIAQYIQAAEDSGKRRTMNAGEVITLDHGVELTAIVANAQDIDGESVNVYFSGRRDDCAENDLSVGVLLTFGDFEYFVGGDLTGVTSEDVADVEELIKDDVQDIDIYHVSHHGAETSSSQDFLDSARPTVSIVSNGQKHGHPRRTVMQRILNTQGAQAAYATNLNLDTAAWQEQPSIADLDMDLYDGVIEVGIWVESYRVWKWRNGVRVSNDRFVIKQ